MRRFALENETVVAAPLPAQTGDLAELRAVKEQLDDLRPILSDPARDPRLPLPEPSLAAVLGVVALSVLVLLGALAAGSAVFAGESRRYLLVGGGVALTGTLAAVWLVRTSLAPQLAAQAQARRVGKQHRRALLARSAELWAALRPELRDDIPLPPDRQPTLWATNMAQKPRLGGPDPEAVLRRLPADAPRWTVWYYRHAGRGVVLKLVAAACILAGAVWPLVNAIAA